MYRTSPFGDHSLIQTSSGGVADQYLIGHLVEQVNEALTQQGVFGIVMKTAVGSRGTHWVEQAVARCAAESSLTRISCSDFSQNLGLGAVLFMLADSPNADTSSDTDVLYTIKKRFQGLSSSGTPMVLVDQAHLMDPRSEWIMGRLAVAGVVRLILLTDHAEQLGPTLSGFLQQRQLASVRTLEMSDTAFAGYLAHRLPGKVSAQAREHYWVASGGDMSVLDLLVNSDISLSVLRAVHGTWILDTRVQSPTCYLRSFDMHSAYAEPKERELLRRFEMEPEVSIVEIGDEPEAVASLRRLFAGGLVENSGTGEIRLRRAAFRIHDKSMVHGEHGITRNQAATSALINIDAGRTEDATRNAPLQAESCEQDGSSRIPDLGIGKHRVLSEFSALMAAGDFPAAQELLARLGETIPKTGEQQASALGEFTLFQWYLEIRCVGRPKIWHSDYSNQGIFDCINDERWHDETSQIVGVLATAHEWCLRGKFGAASRLLRWALNAMHGSEYYLRGERFALWYPHVVFLSYSLSFSLCQWPLMENLDESIASDERHNLTAIGIKEYFGALRHLMHGRTSDCAAALSTVMAQGNLMGSAAGACTQIDIAGLLGTTGPGPLASSADEKTLAVMDPSSDTHWNHAYLHFLHRAYANQTATLKREVRDYAAVCVAAGRVFSAAMAVSISLAMGVAADRDVMQRIANESEDEFARLLLELNEALLENDDESAVDSYCELASMGRHFCVVLAMKRFEKTKPSLRRKMKRTLAEHKNSSGNVPGHAPESGHAPEPGRAINGEATWHSALTSRERSVALMAARGLRNVELAEYFGISVRTIEGHLYQILDKLDLRSRRDLKTIADDADLRIQS